MFRPIPVFLLLWLALLLAACSSPDSTPGRPQSVPGAAMWIGGADGGAWVLLKKNPGDPEYVYRVEVYGDQAGDKWYIGRLEVSPQSGPGVPLDKPEAFGVWDGDSLLLQDGREMRAIDPYDPFKQEG